MIWAFAVAAKYEHPLAQYYLAWNLDNMQPQHREAEKPLFVSNLYRRSLETLKQCYKNNNDACYVLGMSYAQRSARSSFYDPDLACALAYHNAGTDFKNRLKALKLQSIYTRFFKEQPSFQAYLSLGEQGYPLACIEAAKITDDIDKKFYCLNKALEHNCPYAFINKGILYEELGNNNEALKADKAAAQQKVSEGYLKIAEMSLGDMTLGRTSRKYITKSNEKDIEEVEGYLIEAGKLHDPRAWEQLAGLYEELGKIHKNPQQYSSKLQQALFEGMKLGSLSAYVKAYKSFPQEYSLFNRKYKGNSRSELYQEVEEFLRAHYLK